MKSSAPPPSRDLLLKVKAHFIAKGETLASWCRKNKVDQGNVRQALLGSWDGPKGQALREKLAREAGLIPSAKPAAKSGKAAA